VSSPLQRHTLLHIQGARRRRLCPDRHGNPRGREIEIEIGTPEQTRAWTLGAVGWASRMLSVRIRTRPPYAPLPLPGTGAAVKGHPSPVLVWRRREVEPSRRPPSALPSTDMRAMGRRGRPSPLELWCPEGTMRPGEAPAPAGHPGCYCCKRVGKTRARELARNAVGDSERARAGLAFVRTCLLMATGGLQRWWKAGRRPEC
jgi:hypothetical protein